VLRLLRSCLVAIVRGRLGLNRWVVSLDVVLGPILLEVSLRKILRGIEHKIGIFMLELSRLVGTATISIDVNVEVIIFGGHEDLDQRSPKRIES
jgi:uncharacterized membrane protein YcfT